MPTNPISSYGGKANTKAISISQRYRTVKHIVTYENIVGLTIIITGKKIKPKSYKVPQEVNWSLKSTKLIANGSSAIKPLNDRLQKN